MANIPGKLGIQKLVTSTQSLGEFDIDTDGKIKFTTVNAGPTFTIEVKGRIAEQKFFTFIANVVGPTDQVVDVVQWDFLQINITIYDSTSNFVKLDASGFNTEAVGLQTLTVPNGNNLTDVLDLTFTSSNNSVIITGNDITKTIDFQAVGGGGSSTKYIKNVALIDWIGPSAGEYTLTIPFSFHGVTNPVCACYEENASTFDLIMYPVNVDASNNIVIKANQTPDTRFLGKIVIE